MNSTSKSSIGKVLKTAIQIYSTESPTTSKKKERIKVLFERNTNSMLFYNLGRI